MDLLGEYSSGPSMDYEDRSLAGNMERLEEILEEGELFDVWYRDSDDMIGSERRAEEGLESLDAINFLLDQSADFDRYMATWSSLGEINRVRVYENIREGFLGRLLPKRGDEIIFEYREE